MIRLSSLPLLLALAACTTDNYSVVLLRNVVPNAMCVSSADENAVGLLHGTLDVTNPLPDGFLNPGYELRPVALNGTVATPDQTMVGNPNSHIFFVQGAEVELVAGVSSQSQEIIDHLASRGLTERINRFSTSIPPNGVAGLAFLAIDEEQTAAIGEVLGNRLIQIVARVQVFGEIDDSNIRTPLFEYPITLCTGCVVRQYGECALVPASADREVSECNPTQDDGGYACCTQNGEILCPPPPPPEQP